MSSTGITGVGAPPRRSSGSIGSIEAIVSILPLPLPLYSTIKSGIKSLPHASVLPLLSGGGAAVSDDVDQDRRKILPASFDTPG